MKMWAWVTTRIEGYHKWGDAPESVSFLRNKHRHIFHVKVYIEQFHDDRDVEFITLKRQLRDQVLPCLDTEDMGSCEMVGAKIIELLHHYYEGRAIKVEVSEDGENGALVEFCQENYHD